MAHRPLLISASANHFKRSGSVPSPSGSNPKSPGSEPSRCAGAEDPFSHISLSAAAAVRTEDERPRAARTAREGAEREERRARGAMTINAISNVWKNKQTQSRRCKKPRRGRVSGYQDASGGRGTASQTSQLRREGESPAIFDLIFFFPKNCPHVCDQLHGLRVDPQSRRKGCPPIISRCDFSLAISDSLIFYFFPNLS